MNIKHKCFLRRSAALAGTLCFFFIVSGAGACSAVFAEGELTWSQCIQEAAKNHPDLISAQEQVNAQQSSKTIKASSLYPQVSSTFNVSTTETRTASSSSGNPESNSQRATKNSVSYGVSGQQLIFDGFKTINSVKAAQEELRASQQVYRYASVQVRYDLRTAFLNLLKAQELVTVAQDIVKIRRDNLVLITLRYQSGLEHKGALLTAQANLAQANFQLNQSKRDMALAQRQLTKEMGRRDFVPVAAKGDLLIVDLYKEKPDYEAIIKENPLLLEAAAKVNAAFFNVRSTYGDFLPALSVEASAGNTRLTDAPKTSQWSTGLGITYPLFEGGLRLARVSQARAVYRQAEADQRSIKDSLIVDLERTWLLLQEMIETVDVKFQSLEATRERAKIAEAQYSTGFINFDNWIIIQNDLVSAQRSYLDAKANALFAEAQWFQAKGETLEYAQ